MNKNRERVHKAGINIVINKLAQKQQHYETAVCENDIAICLSFLT